MVIYLLSTIITFAAIVYAEVVNNNEADRTTSSNILTNIYPPAVNNFSRGREQAISYANPTWNRMSLSQRAQYIHDVSQELISQKSYNYLSPWIVTCISYHESEFLPQRRTTSRSSTASGLMQVTNTTISGLLQQSWFQPTSPEFQGVARRADTYRMQSSLSMIAQIELGISTLHLKRVEAQSTNIDTILRRYRGSGSGATDRSYSTKIQNCASCMQNSGVSERCLRQAR